MTELGRGQAGTRRGYTIVVWGPTGAPGRTTVAIGLAGALIALGVARTLLVDADLGRGTVAAHLGTEVGGSTLVSACALPRQDGDPCSPRHLQRPRRDGPWVLAGLARPRQWSDVAPEALGRLLGDLSAYHDAVVVDVGAALPPDPRGEGHCACLRAADAIVAVCAASPVGLSDFLIQAPGLAEVLSEEALARLSVVLNHAEPAEAPRYRAQLERELDVPVIGHLPHDHGAVRHALARQRSLVQDAPRTPIAVALLRLAKGLGAQLEQAEDRVYVPNGRVRK